MSAPTTLVRRNLTFKFERAINIVDGNQIPQTMEVTVTPLAAPSIPAAQLTLVGGAQSQTVLLNNAINTVVFQLVPTNAVGLTEPINYLVAWRQGGIAGPVDSQPFAMPDFDTDFDQLSDLGQVLGGASFLQATDLGVPGRVAKLNDAGQVVDADGTPVTMPADLTSINGLISNETVNRQQAVAQLNSTLTNTITQQFGLSLQQAKAYADQITQSLSAEVQGEAASRQDGDALVQSNLNAAQAALQSQITTNANNLAATNTTVGHKADLDENGYVPASQTNPALVMNWVEAADVNAMLALRYPQDIQPGDLVLTPTSVYGFLGPVNAPDPSQLSNWRLLNDVLSVNGKTGAVVLTADDVGAVHATNGSVLMTQVTGLSTALTGKADAATVATLQTAVTTIQNDPTYVHTSSGVIGNALMPANIALISPAGNITKKDGTVVSIGEGSGVSSVNGQTGAVTLAAADVGALATNGTIAESQVTNLPADLAARVLSSDTRLTNARTPTAHAASHGSAGSDPITVTKGQVTGLSTELTTNENNISSLQTRVTTLEASGPGGYGAGVGIFFEGAAATGDFVDNVSLHSPFGYNPTNPNANAQGYYFDPAGAAGADAVWPRINVDGTLAFVKLWTGNGPDPYYASANALSTLSSSVSSKANASDVTALQTTVAGLATQSSVTTLSNTVAGKANQTDLAALQITVNGKANSTDLTALSNTVNTKANASDLTTANNNIATIQTALPLKADLTGAGGVLKASQIPTGIPLASVAQLTSYLAHLNTSGQFDATYLINYTGIPANAIAQAAVNGLPAALAGKAGIDPSTGKLYANLVPSLAVTDTFVVSSQAAMTALSTANQGDVCIINAGPNIGTYILSAPDYSQLANWVELQFPTTAVSSVNGQTGTVVLAASDVGALASNASLPISQISNLQTTLNSLATTTALNTAIATVTTPAQVQALMASSTQNKQAANFVATTAIASLSGQQSVDGVLTPLGSTVLATAQASSINNGLWVVNSGAWTRATDFASGSWLVKGTKVSVTQGNTQANTLWQVTSVSGIIDTNANTWVYAGSIAPPLVYSNGSGLNLTGQQFAVKPSTGGGIAVDGTGVKLDTAVAVRKVVLNVAAGTNPQTLTHNLGTNRVKTTIFDVASGNEVDLGVTITGTNTVSVEFGSAPASNQYQALIIG